MRRPNVIAYIVAAIIAAVLVLGALTMIRVVGFNTDLDFSVETVEEYARWCGRMGDPVAKELDKGRGISGWGNIAEASSFRYERLRPSTRLRMGWKSSTRRNWQA